MGGVWGRCLAFEAPREQGKAGGHEPPLFPLPCHILAFLSSGNPEPPLFSLSVPPHLTLTGKTNFLNGLLRALKA